MSQVKKTAQGKDVDTMESKSFCRDVQHNLGPASEPDALQHFYLEKMDNFYPKACAASFETMLCQPDSYSFFANSSYNSIVFICHTISKPHMLSSGISLPLHVSSRSSLRTYFSGHQQRGKVVQTPRTHPSPQTALYLLPLSQSPSARKLLGFPPTKTNGQ